MLKIGQNWGKIANYPPQCSTKIGTPAFYSLTCRTRNRTVEVIVRKNSLVGTSPLIVNPLITKLTFSLTR